MDESLRAQIDSNLSHLDGLIRRGRKLREGVGSADPSDKSALVANRAWQQDIGVAINQLSGGSRQLIAGPGRSAKRSCCARPPVK